MRTDLSQLFPLIGPLVLTGVAIGLLAVCVYWIRLWLRENEGLAASDHELLAQWRELLRQGELSDEEFRLIKGRIASRIGQSPALPDTPHDGESRN